MDFDFTPEQEAFRKEVRHWLETNLPDDLRGRAFAASRADHEEVRKLRAWQKKMYEGGYVGIDWPREFGGRGASIVEVIILYQEMARAESPQIVNRGGVSMLGPTLMKHGTAVQQKRFLSKILSAEEMWCQGFSEPNAGSDLANLQTRAVRARGREPTPLETDGNVGGEPRADIVPEALLLWGEVEIHATLQRADRVGADPPKV